jgi:hypothetical protein
VLSEVIWRLLRIPALRFTATAPKANPTAPLWRCGNRLAFDTVHP